MNISKHVFNIISIFFLLSNLQAQTELNPPLNSGLTKGIKVINDLKTGTLVVLLPTNAKKIDHIITTLKNKNLAPKQKNRLKDELFKTMQKSNFESQYLLDFFTKHYTFSDIRFAHDTSIVHLKKNITTNIFIGKDLQKSNNIQLEKPIASYVKIGRANKSGTNALALLICDEQNKVMDAPFPYNIILPNDANLKTEKAMFEQVVERTNSRLIKFHKRVNIERVRIYNRD